MAEALGNVSDDAVWRVMRKHDLQLDRRQSWCVSTDPEFSRKASEIVGLYLNPPENAIVLGVDEKPSIQALERVQGYIRLPNGRHQVSDWCSGVAIKMGRRQGGPSRTGPKKEHIWIDR